jgi:DNA-binding response OmpR family regulator
MATTAGEPRKILMIEDDMAMREIVIHKLMTHGFEVKEAEDGKKGIDMLLQEKPDLVLLDLMLPEVDGFKVLETVRSSQDQKVAQTPVIILSNLWSNKDILRTKALKVQAYMVKAYFTTEEILNKINEILASGGKTVMEDMPKGPAGTTTPPSSPSTPAAPPAPAAV